MQKHWSGTGGRAVDAAVRRAGYLWTAPPATGPRDKIKSLADIGKIARSQRERGQVAVQAHGTFDVLVLGHVRDPEPPRGLGDVLVVALTADRYVNKGPGRPVFNEAMRAEMLASLEYVDWVAITEAPDAIGAIHAIRPSFYIKGQDY